MHTYKPRISYFLTFLLLVIPISCLLFYKSHYDTEGGFYNYFWYLSIFVVMMCVAWFSCIQRLISSYHHIIERGTHFLRSLSDSCFGIYLVHIFIMRYLLWNIDAIIYNIGGIGQIIITWILTFAISFVLTWALSYIPYSEYIIGYSCRKRR